MKLPLSLSAAFVLALFSANLRADLIDEVASASRSDLAAGQVVVQSKKIPDAPWPQLSLYQVVDAPTKAMISLLNDYASAPSYTPNMISAKLITTNADGTKDVEYTVKMPVLGKMTYTVRNTYTKSGKSFSVSWVLLKSPFAKKSDGSIRVEPYGNNQTLMCYTNLVIPITNIIPGLQNQALSEAKTTVAAIKAEGEKRAGN